jgi:hypothetical protein
MEIYILIACAALFIGAAVTAFLKNVHMFQLNSYGVGTHVKWMAKKPKSWVAGIFALLFGAVSLSSDFILGRAENTQMLFISCSASYLQFFSLQDLRKRRQKRPLFSQQELRE